MKNIVQVKSKILPPDVSLCIMENVQLPSPIQVISNPLIKDRGITLHIKREDKIHPLISGNKWRKLKYNILKEKSGIITFGGAFSNHIHATAAAGKMYHIPTVGIIRGEYDPCNPTLKGSISMGMKLHFISRSEYKLKEDSTVAQEIINQYHDYHLVPEGGSNLYANQGLKELAEEIVNDYDYIILPAGTGGTIRGLSRAMPEQKFMVFSSLKGENLVQEFGLVHHPHVAIIDRYTFGGYGKTPTALIEFINNFKRKYDIPLDPIYNGKLAFGMMDMIGKGQFDHKKILWVHTGGLQGISAYNYIAQKKGKILID